MSVLAKLLASAPPDAALEIAPGHVAAAVLGSRGRDHIVNAYAIEPLPAGAVVASSGGSPRDPIGMIAPNNNTAPTSPAHPLIRATPFQESMSQRGTGDQPCHGHGEDRVGGKSRLGARHGGAT